MAHCKFFSSSHLHEPGCGVISTVKSGASPYGISANSYNIYSNLDAELKQTRRY